MILSQIWLLIITGVVGERNYFQEYSNLYGYYIIQCPELHTLMPDMNPHQCVSYSLICKDVTEVLVKTEVNGTQHLCHPRFQPWGAGTPTKDQITFHCGYNGGDQLVMELYADGHYKYYCKSFTDDKNKRCLITALQQGLFRCQFCKPPYYGIECKKTLLGFDQRYTNPPKECSGYCLECDDSKSCTKCILGREKQNSSDNTCQLDCVGFTSCSIVSNQLQYGNICMQGTVLNVDRCPSCPQGCLSCTQDQMSPQKRSCDVCDSNYFRELFSSNEPNMYACYKMNYCDFSRQSKIGMTSGSDGLYIYNMRCTLCDPGFTYDSKIGQCQYVVIVKQNCLFLDSSGTNCLACQPWYGLQLDGTCQPISCNQGCFTCLDNDPEICTTCDGNNNKIPQDGTCICKPNHGLKNDVCVLCSEGYCQECDLDDFFSCTSCNIATNRILINKSCICQPGSYEPDDGSLICIVCDFSCLTCFGSTNYECTQCPDESISNRIQVGNSCPCKIGYSDYEIKEAKCGKSHPRCQTSFQAADETTNQYCLSCIPGQNRVVSDSFNCDCKENYGDFEGTSDVCLICDYTCGICNDFGPTHCTQCLESSYRYLTASGECLCKTSYYDDQTENIECQKCHYSCLRCTNNIQQNACVECPLTRKPSDSLATQFECHCLSSHSFDDGLLPTCLECDISCLTCFGPLSSNCLTCNPTYRQLDLSSCICPVGYYDIGQLECEKCHLSCLQCFDNTIEGCTICSIDLHLRVLKGNVCKCIDGYYDESGTSKCKKCSYKCETCEDLPEKCLSCPFNSLRIFDPAIGCFCPGEYYDQENEITCQKCHFKCKSCSSITEESCLSCDLLAFRELKLSQCKCQPHYFEMEVQECTICSALCYECINNFENCTSCQDDRYLVGSTCKCISKFQGALISTFEFNGMVKCQKCHYSCGTCGGVEEGDCISCIDTDHRFQVGNTCNCQQGYFDAGQPICEKCSYKCKGCMKQSEICTSCQDNSLRLLVSGFNTCKCIQRYYDDGQNEVCQKCHYSCLRCNDIETKCELCSIESNRIYNDQLFSCNCNVGYYDNGTEICQKCHYSCFNCNSENANSCIQCVDSITSNRVYYNNSCKCIFGYFDDGQSIQCQKCDIQCLSCINQSYLCVSCPQTRQIESNCKCQQGYYDIGLQLCSKCNSNCFTCQYTSNNCISCDSDQFRELNLITKICDCKIGYLESNGICQQCYPSCKTCSSSLNLCTSCIQFRYLKNNDCICNDGMYESIVDKQCKLCHKTCLTCVYSDKYCLTCSIDNFRIFKSGNTCECIQGYYENPITQACDQCTKSCQTCSILYDNCLTCDTSLNLSLSNNKCLCSQSYYFDSLTNSCQQCHISCLECSNNNECTSCRLTTRHLFEDQKKCVCNDGYYETNQSNCQLCHLSCETCETINTNCLSCMNIFHRILINDKCLCIDGYFDAGIELCQKCNSFCKTCQSSASTCLTCYEIEQNRYQSGDKCLCKTGYFELNTDICSKCSNECLTCQGSSDYCTSCDINSKRIDQSIIHKCPCIIGFYQDQNQICQKCHIKCQTCINQSDQCLSCKFELNSNRLTLSNQCNCKQGYYDDGIQLQCQKCYYRCKTCLNDSFNCQICENQIRINPPTCNCMDGYYEDQQLTCQICAYQCNTCKIYPSNCLTCKTGRFGDDCICIDGYFENGSIFCECIKFPQIYIECGFQCATCSQQSFNCNTCKGNRIQKPSCICEPGYFDDELNEDCQLCNSTCLECNINGCLSCQANRILNDEMDCVPPENSIWYNNTPWCSTCEVAVVKAYLSDDISKIIIHFDFPLNSKGFNLQFELNKCLQLFEQESVKSFGQNSQCFLNPDDNHELLISLGENSKINIGDEILFISNSLSHINCETSLQKFILTTLQMPINPFAPQIEYHVPIHKLNPYAENSVYLKSIKNNGNRKLYNIIWNIQVETNQDIQALYDFIDQINFLQEYNLLIPKLTLPSDALLKFKIQYQNFINIHSFSEFTLQTHSGSLPQISISVKPEYFVYETITIGLSVATLFKSFQVDTSKYMIQLSEIDRHPKKSSSSQLNKSMESNPFEKNQVNITQYSLSPNSTYTFQIIATNLNTNKVQYQNLSIDIPFAGLICQFSNRGIQSIRKDLNLQIECMDLDTRYKWNDDPDLYIQVACKDLSFNNSCLNQQKQIINVNVTDSFQFIKKNSISSFTVQEWSVTVTKFEQTFKFNQIIVYLEDDFPVLELEFNAGYLMRKINNYEQLNFTFLIPFNQKPFLLDQSIAIIYNYEIIEILQPKYISHYFMLFNSIKELRFGDSFNLKFTAQYTTNIMPSLNALKLTLNQPPFCSKLIITRSNDLALTNMIVATTCEQSNDSPYKYQLRLFLREQDLTDFLKDSLDNSLILYSFQYQNQFSIQIPTSVDSSKIGLLLQVLDNGGSITPIYEMITSQPAKINCSSIQFQNLNLQNKIALLFEAMNQKCDDLHNQIYLDLLYQQILPDQNDNILKFQSIKLYQLFLIQFGQRKPQNRLLFQANQQRCYDLNSSHLYVTQNSKTDVNLTKKIEDLKENIRKLYLYINYLSKIKKQSEKEIIENNYFWNQELFQQLQNSQGGLINLLYYVDEIYSNFIEFNTKNETIYLNIAELLKSINLITEEIQNTIMVNEKPLIVEGKEMIWQIKRRTKQIFNQQFNIETALEDYLIDFIQYESTFLQTNPLRLTTDLDNIIQKQFKDNTLQILSDNYYLIKLKNMYKNRYLSYENISSIYSTKFGTYEICSNESQQIEEYEIQCMLRTLSGVFHQCNLNRAKSKETIELICECNSFGEIFLISSTNFSLINVNNNNSKQIELEIISIQDDLLPLIIWTSSLTILFLTTFIIILFRDLIEKSEITEQDIKNDIEKNKMIYKGNFPIFKQKLKYIHQTISIFYYKDQHIQLSYRILEAFSQFNLLLTFNILEFYYFNSEIPLLCAFMIINPLIVFILRIIYKIVESIYRFRRIYAIISQLFLIMFLILPNLIVIIFNYLKLQVQQEKYLMGISFSVNILISQILIEPISLFGRIVIYRLIALSLKEMELNPYFHLMHFFVFHSSLEEIFDEFIKI